MKSIAVAGLAAASIVVSAPAMASAKLAAKSNCLACHTAEMKLVGPAYRDVAKKYAGVKGAETMLVAKVRKGSTGGVWGPIPMPPIPANVNNDELRTLIKWILAGAKQ